MKFDFDQINNRRNTNSLKWNVLDTELPMWVADMDFQTAPAITEAIQKKAQTGIFGYNIVPEEWQKAIIGWWKRRHQYEIKKEWLTFCTGVIPAVTSAVKRITNVGDNVVVQTPVYNIFFHSVENTGRHVLENKLLYDGKSYQIDFKDLEEKLSNPLTTMMILCNPQNPSGKIWTREELATIGALCKKHHVTVISDEIHCDLTDPGYSYVPFASVSEECADICIMCISATKAFNIAGLQSAAVIISNEELREKVVRGLNSDEVAEPNTFATEAVIAAFNEGEEWLTELNSYLYENKKAVAEYIEKELPKLKLVESHATYLLWIDCNRVVGDTTEFCHFLREKTGLFVSAGSPYRGNGNHFFRMNIACPRTQVMEGLRRLKDGIGQYEEMVTRRC
ncbi:MAG: pyridoxal phosphate-dependent aminotransferase [Lachnospiraceae bacterium]|nr:pyridoxal phosphate-dependent aminotransferase [Lachnospiraceae bacterium]